MIERSSLAVADEWRQWSGKGGRIADDIGEAQLIKPAAEGRIDIRITCFQSGIMLFGAEHQERIGGVVGGTPVKIANVASRALRRADRLAIDKYLHKAIQPSHGRHMMPLAVIDALSTAHGRTTAVN